MKIRLAYYMDDSGKSVSSGGELCHGERLDRCIGSEYLDRAAGIYIFCAQSVAVVLCNMQGSMCPNMLIRGAPKKAGDNGQLHSAITPPLQTNIKF